MQNLQQSRLNEASLVRLYMELTGASEARARATFMHLCCQEDALAARCHDMSFVLRKFKEMANAEPWA